LAVVGLALVAQVVLAVPVAAHARVVGSSPVDGATIDRAPGEVMVELDAKPATIEGEPLRVYGPDGGRIDAADPRVTDGGRRLWVSLDPAHDLPSGDYEIAYRIVSADTHVIAGRLSFTTRLPRHAEGTAAIRGADGVGDAGAPFVARSGAEDPVAGSEHLIAGGLHDTRPLLVAAGALVLAVLSLSLRRRRRRRRQREHRVEPSTPPRRRPSAPIRPQARRPGPSRDRPVHHHPRRRVDVDVAPPLVSAFWEATAAAAGSRHPLEPRPSVGGRQPAAPPPVDDRRWLDIEDRRWF
jgi:methionine-rich copper-binding protein CopC